jgi:nucleotide-binding universal stress UspA family protein
MFHKILIALDHSKADAELISRVAQLARLTGAQILLLHVSTGWAAAWQEQLNLSDSPEMVEDRRYLEKMGKEVHAQGIPVELRHANGKPAEAILKTAREEKCDLITMATHGHRGLSDIIYGETIDKVRHESEIPIFLIKPPAE